MNITITINTDSDAFQGNDVEDVEVRRILRQLADHIQVSTTGNRKLIDYNGIACGTLDISA